MVAGKLGASSIPVKFGDTEVAIKNADIESAFFMCERHKRWLFFVLVFANLVADHRTGCRTA